MSALLTIIAVSALLHVIHGADPIPIQHRIAYSPTGMTVSWSTVGPLSGSPVAEYGLDRYNLTATTSGETLHYVPSITWFHHVQLTALRPRTRYYWRPLCAPKSDCTIYNFTTAVPAGENRPFTVAINGDFGLKNSETTMRRMNRILDDITFFWHIGDISYADDWLHKKLNGTTYEEDTETFLNLMSSHHLLESTPWQLLPGNHEASCTEGVQSPQCYEGQKNFTSFRQRWRMPYEASGSSSNMWYSFDYGLVHFINFDTETDFEGAPEGVGTHLNSGPFTGPAGTQLEWLRKDLIKAHANRDKVPWIMAGGHRPFYSGHTKDGVHIPSRDAFEPLFNEFQVDLVFFGHIHWTERMYALAPNGTVLQRDYNNPKNPIYIISASVGNVEGLSKPINLLNNITLFLDGEHYGIGRLHVANRTHCIWRWILSETGEAKDEAVIYKAHDNMKIVTPVIQQE